MPELFFKVSQLSILLLQPLWAKRYVILTNSQLPSSFHWEEFFGMTVLTLEILVFFFLLYQ